MPIVDSLMNTKYYIKLTKSIILLADLHIVAVHRELEFSLIAKAVVGHV